MKPSVQRRGGFTLVELLVAAAITAALAGLLLGFASDVLRSWHRVNGERACGAQAELVLDFLARDLRAAVLRRDGPVWLAATVQPDQHGNGDPGGSLATWPAAGQGKPGWARPGTADSSLQLRPVSARLEECRFGMAGVWLRLIATVPDDNAELRSTSAPRAVGYQLVRYALAARAGATVRYGLFRSEVRPTGARSTLAAGYDLFAEAYNQPALGGTDLADPGTVRRPRRDQLLANNVVDFGVRIWARRAGGRLEIVFPRADTNLGFAATVRDGTTVLAPALGANPAEPPLEASAQRYGAEAMSYGFPEHIEVLVRVLTEAGARELEALEAGRTAGRTWWEVALAHSRVYTRWIPVEGVPP